MKRILKSGIGTTAFMYLNVSLYNHTWNAMCWSQDSCIWFGLICGFGWLGGILFVELESVPFNKIDFDK